MYQVEEHYLKKERLVELSTVSWDCRDSLGMKGTRPTLSKVDQVLLKRQPNYLSKSLTRQRCLATACQTQGIPSLMEVNIYNLYSSFRKQS